MKKYCNEIIGFFIVSILGIVFHFIFEWTSNSRIVAIIAPVNESIFEHLKVSFYPFVIWGIIRWFIDGKDEPNYLSANIYGVLTGMIFIIVSYYTYSGIIGNHFFIIDMIIYGCSIILALIITKNLIDSPRFDDNLRVISWIILFIIVLVFVIFTFNPPHINLFKDPSTGNYGI